MYKYDSERKAAYKYIKRYQLIFKVTPFRLKLLTTFV